MTMVESLQIERFAMCKVTIYYVSQLLTPTGTDSHCQFTIRKSDAVLTISSDLGVFGL